MTVSLTLLTAAKCRIWVKESQRSGETKSNKEFRDILQDLWLSCVTQICIELQRNGVHPENNELLRLWWESFGLASSLLFHAAGEQSMTSTGNTVSHFISSYTPTIKTLSYSRQRTIVVALSSSTKSQLLLVTSRLLLAKSLLSPSTQNQKQSRPSP